MEIMSAQIVGTNKDTELKFMWGLYGVPDPCQGRPLGCDSPSDGFHVHRHSTDHCGKLTHSANFDEECRKIQSRLKNSASADLNDIGDRHGARELAKIQPRRAGMGSGIADCRLVKDSRGARRNNKRDDAESSFCHLASTSAEMRMNKLAVAAQSFQEESILSKFPLRDIHHGNCDVIDGISMQMKAKFVVDQVFLARKYIHEAGMRSQSYSFRSSQMGHFVSEEPGVCIARKIKSSSQRPLQNLASKLDADEGLAPGGSMTKATGKVIIQKPVDKVFEGISCNCSSLTSKTLRGTTHAKASHFSFKKMQRMLKHAFDGTARDIRLFSGSCSSDGVSEGGSSSLVKIMDSHACSTKREDPSMKNMKKNHKCVSTVTHSVGEERAISRRKKQKLDILSEAKRQLSLRWNNRQCEERLLSKQSSKALQQILSSHECDLRSIGPRRDCTFGSPQMIGSVRSISGRIMDSRTRQRNGREIARLCALAAETEVSSANGCYIWESGTSAKASSQAWRRDEVMHSINHLIGENVNPQGPSNTMNSQGHSRMLKFSREMNNVTRVTEPEKIDSYKESPVHSVLDSLSENEVSTSTTDDFSSTSSSIHQLSDGLKHHKEHRSPTSVLEPFLVENRVTSNEEGELQPLHLLFEDECSSEPFPENKPQLEAPCTEEQNHLSQYVHIVLQASGLNWNELSEIEFPREQLLKDSLFEEVDFTPDHCCFDTRLLFDHINEVLIKIHESRLMSVGKLRFLKPKSMTAPLAIAVIDQIRTEESFYFPPRTNRRTLDQLVSEDVRKCASWLDIKVDMGIVVDISEGVLNESILDMLLEFID